MLEGFFVELKSRGVPVSLTEWMTLQEALDKDLARSSLDTFYYLARSVLVKSETVFDRYDRAFQSFFKGVESREDMVDEILKAMESIPPEDFEALARKAGMEGLSLEEVLKNFREQFEEGHFRDHFGGSKAIGRG
ncbi:MAG: VWA containing CoxE family protein, partial [Deltaproteobacteria bacterium]|nr:VWA containing CoxE family protein [Deltaproteobacteria bacterium]